MDRASWLTQRRQGIGGSDVAAILGVSPWTSPFDVWLDKTGRIESQPDETPAQRRGRLLEDAVARWYAEDSGHAVAAGSSCVGPEPWILGNTDRTVPDLGAVLECKTARSADGWGESGADVTMREAHTVVPVSYALQVAWYLEATGLDRAEVAVLVMTTDDFRRYTLRRDRDFGAALVDRCRAWWTAHVVADLAPPIEGTDTAHAWLLAEHPSDLQPMRPADEAEAALMAELRAAGEAADAADKRRSTAEAAVKQAIGDGEGLWADGARVTWKAQAGRKSLDLDRLRAELPEVAEKYTRQGAATRVLRKTWK